MNKILTWFTLMLIASLWVGETQAAVTFNVTGVYDSNSNVNVVDHSATTTTGNQVGLDDFKTWVSTAYAGGYGGVIDFEGPGGWSVKPQGTNPNDYLIAKYGSGMNSTLNISNTGSAEFLVGSVTDRTPISGERNLGKSGTVTFNNGFNAQDFAFGFNPADQIVGVGATMLSRQSNSGNVTATVRFSDGTFATITTNVAGTNANDDTFFGFRVTDEQLGSGIYITGLEFVSGQFRAIDDLAFIVVPEPKYCSLLLFGAIGLAWRRRR